MPRQLAPGPCPSSCSSHTMCRPRPCMGLGAGCGNAFCGAFVAALQAGDGLAAAGAWGCVAASFMAEARGMPTEAPGHPDVQAQAAQRLEVVLSAAVQLA